MTEQQKTSIEGLKKTENTSPLNSILTIDNPESKAKIEGIYTGLDAQKQTAFIEKLRENQTKLEMFQDAPDDIGNLLQEILQELNLQNKEQEVKTTEQEVKTTEQADIVTKNEVRNDKEGVLKETREQLEKTYTLFGGKEKFEQLPGHGDWKELATKRVQEEAVKKDEKLSAEELATRVETSIILSHNEAIKSSLPIEKQGEFANLNGQLRASADFLKIPYETTPEKEPHTKGTENKITTELLGFKSGDKVIRTGSEYRFGDQVIDISKVPPERSVERNGIRITFDDKEGMKAKNYQEQEDYREKKGSLAKKIGELETDIKTNRESMQEKYLKLPEMKTKYEMAIKEGELADAEWFKNLIEKTKKELEEFKQKTEKLAILKEALAVLEKEEQERDARYQESLQSETEASRSNLTFLASTHLDGILKNDGVQTLVKEIDKHKDTLPVTITDKSSSLSLNKEWGEPEKRLLAAGISRLLGMEGEKSKQLFASDGYTMRAVGPDGHTPMKQFLKDTLTSRGVYDSGKIPPVTVEGVKRGMVVKAEGKEVERML
ncbi:MAG: hypothetical protein Q8K26_02340 [Candidatus Gracilibacteria bacterium]|nr:hypothetical protein [Candidatus Gracilibacteria bacterium]